MLELLTDRMAEISNYLLIGFISCNSFYLFNYKSKDNIANILVKYYILGYGILNIYFEITNNTYYSVKEAVLLNLSTIIISMVIGKIFNKLINSVSFLTKLGIRKSASENFWYNVIDQNKSMWLTAYDIKNGYKIQGVPADIEDLKDKPQIALSRYMIKSIKDDSVLDIKKDYYSNFDYCHRVTIDTNKFDYIELYYNSDSPLIQNTKQQINYEKELYKSNK